MPPRRLGALLREARAAAGDDLAAVAARSGGAVDAVRLHAVESGDVVLDDSEVRELLHLYDIPPSVATRTELVIDLDDGTVAAGPWSTTTEGPAHADDVLIRYLALLYEMRGLAPGTALPLRTLDLDVLSQALALPVPDVEQRLDVLMAPDDGRVDRLRRALSLRVLVPAAGLVVAATAAGALVLLPGGSPATPTGSELGRATGTAAATALSRPDTAVVGLDVSGSVASSPTTIDPPRDVEPATDTAPPVVSTAPDPSQVAPPGADEPEIGDGLTIDTPDQVAPPGADEPEIGEALTIEAP